LLFSSERQLVQALMNPTSTNTTPNPISTNTQQELQAAGREECDALHEELDRAHEALAALEQQVAALEGFRSAATQGEAALAETMQTSARVAGDLAQFKKENDSLMQVGLVVGKRWRDMKAIGHDRLFSPNPTRR